MRIVVLTEDEPFYAAESFRRLLSLLPEGTRIVLAVVTRFAPLGSHASRAVNIARLGRLFGPVALTRLSFPYLWNKLRPAKWVETVFDEHGIPRLDGVEHVNAPETVAAIRAAAPDLLVSVSAHRLFGRALLDVAPCLNVHLSLLPRHRGLAPVFWSLHAGDTETGVSVYLVDESVDDGTVLVQRRVPIRSRRFLPLYRELKLEGMRALAEAVRLAPANHGRTHRVAGAAASLNGLPSRSDVRSFFAGGNRLV